MILFRPAASRELADDVRYYDEHYPGRGQRFAQAVDSTLVLIAELPLAFPILYEPDIRSAKVPRFPYRVVYVLLETPTEPTIDVLAIAHAKRRPYYWSGRMG